MRLADKRDTKNPDVKTPAELTEPGLYWDSDCPGFGLRVNAGGARSFFFNYRHDGVQRRVKIGRHPAWKVAAARQEAEDLRHRVDGGDDPVAERKEKRDAPTVSELCERFKDEHLPNKRPSTQRDYNSIIDREILPTLKQRKVSEITFDDVAAIHRRITRRGKPYHANHAVAVMSKLFSLSIRWGWRTDNPATGIERNDEQKRERYLSADELARLAVALTEHNDQQAADIIRLLMLTGARRGEVQGARWDQFDLQAGVWSKPSASTKQRKPHRVPLSPPALALLNALRETAADDAVYVFPGRHGKDHRIEIKGNWASVCKAAGMMIQETKKDRTGRERTVVVPSARIHDLRHTYASVLASSGTSLQIIGALLGHTQIATTMRYAHLLDAPLKTATDQAGAILSGKPSA